MKNSNNKVVSSNKVNDTQKVDSKNLNFLIDKIKSKNLNAKKESLGKRELYKKSKNDFEKESEYKNYKKKMRLQLQTFCNNIQIFFAEQKESELKLTLERFEKFYKDNYILNDYSAESLRFNNADESTKNNIDDMLLIIKHYKQI